MCAEGLTRTSGSLLPFCRPWFLRLQHRGVGEGLAGPCGRATIRQGAEKGQGSRCWEPSAFGPELLPQRLLNPAAGRAPSTGAGLGLSSERPPQPRARLGSVCGQGAQASVRLGDGVLPCLWSAPRLSGPDTPPLLSGESEGPGKPTSELLEGSSALRTCASCR